jgi:hypothetical protein
MEETIWMFFGILGMLIALGIIGPLLYNQTQTFSEDKLHSGIIKIKNQANFLCSTSIGNSISTTLDLYYNTTLYTKEDKVCVKGGNHISCERISCQFEESNLTLDSELAKEFFQLEYTCLLEVRARGLLSIECRG